MTSTATTALNDVDVDVDAVAGLTETIRRWPPHTVTGTSPVGHTIHRAVTLHVEPPVRRG